MVVAYGGRALHAAEKNYSTTELEALAVVEGIKKYAPYLQHGVRFIVVTDHCALKWLFNGNHAGGRLARWSLKLQAYNFEVVHKRGKSNSNADALSRVNRVGVVGSSQDNHDCIDCTRSRPNVKNNPLVSTWLESNLDDISVIEDANTVVSIYWSNGGTRYKI